MNWDPRYLRGPRGRGGGFGRGREEDDLPPVEGAAAWFGGRLPEGWFESPVEVQADRDEILVVGRIPAPEIEGEADEASTGSGAEAARALAEAGRITRFREETREARIGIAREAEHRFGRKVAWGVECGGTRQLFTTLSVPVMTRLRQPERLVLDTLVDAGVARSRSEALAWAVRLVAQHTDDWLGELRAAMASVEEVRARGPQVD